MPSINFSMDPCILLENTQLKKTSPITDSTNKFPIVPAIFENFQIWLIRTLSVYHENQTQNCPKQLADFFIEMSIKSLCSDEKFPGVFC